MFEELRNRIKAAPFIPFTVYVADGRAVSVPNPDHILVTSAGLVVIENDQGLLDILPVPIVSGIRTESAAA
jgi:hypothetical protein